VKTELPVIPANPTLHHNFSIQLSSSSITPSRSARYIRVVIDDQLNFTDHIELPGPADLPCTTIGRSVESEFAVNRMRTSRLVTTVQAGGGGVMLWMFSWHTLGPFVPIGHRLNITA